MRERIGSSAAGTTPLSPPGSAAVAERRKSSRANEALGVKAKIKLPAPTRASRTVGPMGQLRAGEGSHDDLEATPLVDTEEPTSQSVVGVCPQATLRTLLSLSQSIGSNCGPDRVAPARQSA